MMTLSEDASEYIAAGLGSDTADQLAEFLNFGESRLTNRSSPHHEHVRDALMLWSVRAANTGTSGVRIEGIEGLVVSLRSLDPDDVLERYDQQSGRALLTIYRNRRTKRPIGYQYVNAPRPNTKSMDKELNIVLPPTTSKAVVKSARSPVAASNRKEKLRHG